MRRVFVGEGRRPFLRALWAVFLVAMLAACAMFAQQPAAVKPAPVTMSAAISLKDALDQLGREYDETIPGQKSPSITEDPEHYSTRSNRARPWIYFSPRRRSKWTRCKPRD